MTTGSNLCFSPFLKKKRTEEKQKWKRQAKNSHSCTYIRINVALLHRIAFPKKTSTGYIREAQCLDHSFSVYLRLMCSSPFTYVHNNLLINRKTLASIWAQTITEPFSCKMMCTTSIYLVAHRDSKQTEKSSHFEHNLNAKIVNASGQKWITYKHTQHVCDTAVRYSHSQCQTEQILIYNYFYCHTEFIQHINGVCPAGYLADTVFIFVQHRLVSLSFSLSGTFLPIWMFPDSFHPT